MQKLALARSGDRISLGELLSEFWQPLWAHAKLTLNQNVQPKQAASDIVQETFVEAQHAIEEFKARAVANSMVGCELSCTTIFATHGGNMREHSNAMWTWSALSNGLMRPTY